MEFTANPELTFAMAKLRQNIVEKNLNLKEIFKGLPSELDQQDLQSVLSFIDPQLTPDEISNIFTSTTQGSETVSTSDLFSQFSKHKIDINMAHIYEGEMYEGIGLESICRRIKQSIE